MNTIDVVIADDHAVVRTGYRRLLELEEGVRVVAEFGDSDAAYAWLTQYPADVLILDLSMPGRGGMEVLQRLGARVPALRILVFSMHDSAAIVSQAMRAGAAGYLTKSSAPEALVDAVRKVAQGRQVLSDDVAGMVDAGSRPPPHLALSPREFDLFRLFARGTAIEEVAAQLYLSTKTVANYQTLIRKKMGLANRVEMHRYAVEHGFG
ncbi:MULTISPECIES: response regulator transcription factor [unclassified Cupriavidus]|uniref:response regulator transcription factor n=1 Tax=unclassified Cupriavidus TaxID=2640874 RepID=UPI00227135AB|nr:response regulator transcription factor [Cupriavidus sp. D39]MCY0854535.1 response regulator transcription factor [Cupriavidus sp. D39]